MSWDTDPDIKSVYYELQEVNQFLRDLKSLLEGALDGIERITRPTNREWRVMEVKTSELTAKGDEFFNAGWELEHVLCADDQKEIGVTRYPRRLLLVFSRLSTGHDRTERNPDHE